MTTELKTIGEIENHPTLSFTLEGNAWRIEAKKDFSVKFHTIPSGTIGGLLCKETKINPEANFWIDEFSEVTNSEFANATYVERTVIKSCIFNDLLYIKANRYRLALAIRISNTFENCAFDCKLDLEISNCQFRHMEHSSRDECNNWINLQALNSSFLAIVGSGDITGNVDAFRMQDTKLLNTFSCYGKGIAIRNSTLDRVAMHSRTTIRDSKLDNVSLFKESAVHSSTVQNLSVLAGSEIDTCTKVSSERRHEVIPEGMQFANRDLDIGCEGLSMEIPSGNNECYHVTILPEKIIIGCQSHDPWEWGNFDDEAIHEMDSDSATDWWTSAKLVVMAHWVNIVASMSRDQKQARATKEFTLEKMNTLLAKYKL
jgi:hypothetical protein